MKQCSKCKILKPLDEYHTSIKRGKPYTYPHCRTCHRDMTRSWYQTNREYALEQSVAWNKAHPYERSLYMAKHSKAYYMNVQSALANRCIALFKRMGESRRSKFAIWILNADTNLWNKAKRVHALDEWLAEYSGI